MKNPSKDQKAKFNSKIRENNGPHKNNFEINSVSSNEDNDFLLPIISDSLIKNITKSKTTHKSDLNTDIIRSFRVRKVGKEPLLAPLNLPNQPSPQQLKLNILPTPKKLPFK